MESLLQSTKPTIEKFRDFQKYTLKLIDILKERHPAEHEQGIQIVKQIEQEFMETRDYPVFEHMFCEIIGRVNRLCESAELERQIAEVRAECFKESQKLSGQINLETSKLENWGTPVGYQWGDLLIKDISRIIVDKPEKQKGGLHDYYDYRIIFKTHYKNGGKDRYYKIRRRFNDIKELSEKLQKGITPPPPLPPQKHYLFGGSNDQFITERKQLIQSWLSGLCAVSAIVFSNDFQRFCLDGGEWRYAEQGYD